MGQTRITIATAMRHELDRCFLFAQDAEDFGLIGYGMIDGNAESFPNAGDKYRPMMLRLLNCKQFHLEHLRLMNAQRGQRVFLTASISGYMVWISEMKNATMVTDLILTAAVMCGYLIVT